jgi:hypothetical protein
MSRTVTFIGARGGQGTSTIAAALAFDAASDVPTSLLTHDPTAMARLLGAQPSGPGPFLAAPDLTVAGLDGPRSTLTVIDAGSATNARDHQALGGERYAVVRGPCYLSLATLVSLLPDLRLDGVVLVAEPGRALSAADVTEVLALPVVATVPVRPAVARLIDAGLLAGKPTAVSGLRQLRDGVIRGAGSRPERLVSHPGRLVAAQSRVSHDREAPTLGWEIDR